MKEILIGTWAWGTGSNGSSIVFGKKQDPEMLKQSFEKAVKRFGHHLRAGAVEHLHFTFEGLHPRQGAYPLLHRGHRLLRDGGATRHAGLCARHL